MLLDEDSIQRSDSVLIREYRDQESLLDMQAHLEEADIPYSVFDTVSRFDVTFSYDHSRRSFQLLVPQHFADRARRVCETVEAAIIEQLPPDYYLFDFSDEELKSLIIKPFEWSPLDVTLARQILKQRGIDPDSEELVQNENAAKTAFDAPERLGNLSLFFGYLFAAMGGLIGIAFIIYIFTSKKTTHDGAKIKRFDKRTYQHAIYMILTFLVSTCLFLAIRILAP